MEMLLEESFSELGNAAAAEQESKQKTGFGASHRRADKLIALLGSSRERCVAHSTKSRSRIT